MGKFRCANGVYTCTNLSSVCTYVGVIHREVDAREFRCAYIRVRMYPPCTYVGVIHPELGAGEFRCAYVVEVSIFLKHKKSALRGGRSQRINNLCDTLLEQRLLEIHVAYDRYSNKISAFVVYMVCIFRYTIVVGDGSAEVRGAITVRGHYFENGNIQLQTSKEVAAKTVSFSVSVSKMKRGV